MSTTSTSPSFPPSRLVRSVVAALAIGGTLAAGCRSSGAPVGGGSPAEGPSPAPTGPGLPGAPTQPSAQPEVAAPAPPPTEEGRVLVVEDSGKERLLTGAEAQAGGYTIVDLGDDWTPLIFEEHHAADGRPLPNRYRRVFLGLANDQLDEDGQPLEPGERNYLELYGIFPSFSVLRARFLEDEGKTCDDQPTPGLSAVEIVSTQGERPASEQRAAFTEAEARLACEGFLGKDTRHKPGTFDEPMRHAIRRFQQKHMIYESHALRRRTVEALRRPLLENDQLSAIRSLRERVVAAAGIIEDGTAGSKGTYRTMTGETRQVQNLADEYTAIAAKLLGLDTVAGALAFFRRHDAERFKHFKVGLKLPQPPEYHGPQMDLQVVIDRGDVWYDLPWDETGTRQPQPRKKYPSFQLMLNYRGKKVPLIAWRTTIGGWRAEQAADGYEYFRYKGSDVGPRIIKQIIAGPVWIAPPSTPIRSLVKVKRAGKGFQKVVNYDELGPGYLSAYGLVAGYFVMPNSGFDNGIRAHGSSDYLSIYSDTGYSHGCHRLPNHLAIRLYSFLLRHRPMRVVGDLTMDFARQFLRDDEVFEIRIPSRGYAYALDPPLPVEVLEGEIKGKTKEPVLTYVPKPGVVYPGPPPPVPDSPEARAGGAPAAAPAGKGKRAAGSDEEEAP